MDMKNLVEQLEGLFDGVHACLQAKLYMPSLILIYSTMDIVGSLERHPSEGTRASFTRWVESYLLPASSLPCTAIELYAARCAILHTLSTVADLTQSGKARPIVYVFGTWKAADLQSAIEALGRMDVAIHVGDLLEAFIGGVKKFLGEIEHDAGRQQAIRPRVDLWLTAARKIPVPIASR